MDFAWRTDDDGDAKLDLVTHVQGNQLLSNLLAQTTCAEHIQGGIHVKGQIDANKPPRAHPHYIFSIYTDILSIITRATGLQVFVQSVVATRSGHESLISTIRIHIQVCN